VQTFAVLAKRGAGKTYTTLVLVEEMLKAQLQVVVADPVGVTWGCAPLLTARVQASRSWCWGGTTAISRSRWSAAS
jgi:hypothetical protein